MKLCCKFHLTGGDFSLPCNDSDAGSIIIGEPLGPEEDETEDEEEEEEQS